MYQFNKVLSCHFAFSFLKLVNESISILSCYLCSVLNGNTSELIKSELVKPNSSNYELVERMNSSNYELIELQTH